MEKRSRNSKDERNPQRSTKSRLGSVRNIGGAEDVSEADWTSVDPKTCMALVALVASMGGATRFGYTRDGGAFSIGLYLDDDRETLYYPPGSEMEANIQNLIYALGGK